MIFYGSGKNSASKTSDGRPSHYDRFLHVSCPYPVYADPPYFTAHERTFVEYGRRSFGKKDLQDLIDGLQAAEERGAEIALTYSDGMPIEVPSHWVQTRFEVTRNVGGFRGSRKKNNEVLYTSVPLRYEA
ncbi:hypothetical protein, partial [Sinorhizobium meliloti]|uniref:hypothetical protein n=1 Tax=Rhizobium meliloti TaxID=382 RepID=UPI001AECBEC0